MVPASGITNARAAFRMPLLCLLGLAIPAIPVSAFAGGQRFGTLYFIRLGDNGAHGPVLGCGDSRTGVRVRLADPDAPLKSLYTRLLSIRTARYGGARNANTLAGSRLSLKSVSLKNGVARVELRGSLRLSGVCDGPRIRTQLEHPALQFRSVKRVVVTINDQPLSSVLSEKG